MERILVGVDGSPAGAGAAAWAAQLAHDLGVSLVVASVWQPSRAELPEPEAGVERDRALHLLEESWSQPARALEVSSAAVLVDGDSPDALLETADEVNAGLVVVGTRGSGGFRGLRIGSFSDYLAHRTTRPLSVIPATARPGVRSIVVGLDGSQGSLWALGLCCALAGPLGAEVVAVYAHRPRSWRSPLQGWQAQAHAALEDWAAPLRDLDIKVETRLVETTHGAEALLDVAATTDADVILIGTRDLTDHRLLRLGGVTMQLLHQSDRPVIIVPPPD